MEARFNPCLDGCHSVQMDNVDAERDRGTGFFCEIYEEQQKKMQHSSPFCICFLPSLTDSGVLHFHCGSQNKQCAPRSNDNDCSRAKREWELPWQNNEEWLVILKWNVCSIFILLFKYSFSLAGKKVGRFSLQILSFPAPFVPILFFVLLFRLLLKKEREQKNGKMWKGKGNPSSLKKMLPCCCSDGSSLNIRIRSISCIALLKAVFKSHRTVFHGPFSPAVSTSWWTFRLEIPIPHKQSSDTLLLMLHSASRGWKLNCPTPQHHWPHHSVWSSVLQAIPASGSADLSRRLQQDKRTQQS